MHICLINWQRVIKEKSKFIDAELQLGIDSIILPREAFERFSEGEKELVVDVPWSRNSFAMRKGPDNTWSVSWDESNSITIIANRVYSM